MTVARPWLASGYAASASASTTSVTRPIMAATSAGVHPIPKGFANDPRFPGLSGARCRIVPAESPSMNHAGFRILPSKGDTTACFSWADDRYLGLPPPIAAAAASAFACRSAIRRLTVPSYAAPEKVSAPSRGIVDRHPFGAVTTALTSTLAPESPNPRRRM